MLRVLIAVVAALAAFMPGMKLGLEAAERWAPGMCPPPDGPNICALALAVAITWVAPFVASALTGLVVWRLLPAGNKRSRE
ncbi:MAG: hypothetical protein R3E42_01000 [Burkholderiaceae bacterium]